MLVLSDMSGPSMVRGFESYLTGYPLLDTGAHALARTWYAPEMDRPGCVWTHTLIIENADLARIKELRILLGLFARPGKERGHSYYRSQLAVSDVPDASTGAKNDFEGLGTLTLAGLYGSPSKAVLIPAERSDEYENLVVAIWSQQWPRLRRSFWFCTGAIANRIINGQTFDLQVVPEKLIDHLTLEFPTGECTKIEKNNSSNYQNNLPSWLFTTSKDLFEKKDTPVRRFLWDFGAETSKGRGAFVSLVETFLIIELSQKGEAHLSDITKFVSNHFSGAKDFSSLKKAIFGDAEGRRERVVTTFDEIDLLRELSTTPHHQSFAPEPLGLAQRAEKLAKHDPLGTMSIIDEMPLMGLNPLQQEILEGFLKKMKPADIINLSKEKPELLVTIVQSNPSWAASSEIWSLSAEQQNMVWNTIVASLDIDQEILNAMVGGMLDAGSDKVANDVGNRFEDKAVKAVLAWLDSSGVGLNHKLPGGWLGILISAPSSLQHRLRETPEPSLATMAIMSEVLDPNSQEVSHFGAKVWLPLAKAAHSQLTGKALTRTMAFLLALGFNNPGPGADKLVAYAFEAVHDAAARSQLEYDSWRPLRDHVLLMFLWWYWDKCRLLREALVEKFILHKWPVQSFLKSVKNPDTFHRIAEYCLKTKRRREFLKEVTKETNKDKSLAR